MIRALTEADRSIASALLSQSNEYNLYALGNLDSVGFDNSGLSEFWGDFDKMGKLRGIINRYMSGWVVFGKPQADWAALASIMDGHPLIAGRLQDNPGGIESFMPYLKTYVASQSSVQSFMALDGADFASAPPRKDIQIRRATVADTPALARYYAEAGHMSRSAEGVARPIEHTRLWFALHQGEICSAALTNAELDEVAMIGGVYTPEKFRNRGYSGSICSKLCAELLAEGKRPVLYWETPAAGSVYRKLGFRKIGDWRSLRLQRIH